MDQQQNRPAQEAHQGGTATAETPATFEHPPFTLNDQQTTDLQRYRTDAIKPGFADNALSVLLVGRAGWNISQVQQAFGIKASDAARACRAWADGGLRGLMNASEATYIYNR